MNPETSSQAPPASLTETAETLEAAAQEIAQGQAAAAQESLSEAREELTAAAAELMEETALTDRQAQIMAEIALLTERLERLEMAAQGQEAAQEIAQEAPPAEESVTLVSDAMQETTQAANLYSRLKNNYSSPLKSADW